MSDEETGEVKYRTETDVRLNAPRTAIEVEKCMVGFKYGEEISRKSIAVEQYDLCCSIEKRAISEGKTMFLCLQDGKYIIRPLKELGEVLRDAGLTGGKEAKLSRAQNLLQQSDQIPTIRLCDYIGIDQETFAYRFPMANVQNVFNLSELLAAPWDATYEESKAWLEAYFAVIREAARKVGVVNAWGVAGFAAVSVFGGTLIRNLGLNPIVILHGPPDTSKTHYAGAVCNVLSLPGGVVEVAETITPAMYAGLVSDTFQPLVIDENNSIPPPLVSILLSSTTANVSRRRRKPSGDLRGVESYRRSPFLCVNIIPDEIRGAAQADRIAIFGFDPNGVDNLHAWNMAKKHLLAQKGNLLTAIAHAYPESAAPILTLEDAEDTVKLVVDHPPTRNEKKAIACMAGLGMLSRLATRFGLPDIAYPQDAIIKVLISSSDEIVKDDCDLILITLEDMHNYYESKGFMTRGDPNAPYVCADKEHFYIPNSLLPQLNRRLGSHIKSIREITQLFRERGILQPEKNLKRINGVPCRVAVLPRYGQDIDIAQAEKPFDVDNLIKGVSRAQRTTLTKVFDILKDMQEENDGDAVRLDAFKERLASQYEMGEDAIHEAIQMLMSEGTACSPAEGLIQRTSAHL